MITKIYSIISNGGDGSVSMSLYDSAEVADWIEENNPYDGWAEPSRDEIEIEHEGRSRIRSEGRYEG